MKARNKITGKEITILGISKESGMVSYIADGVLYQDYFASGAIEIIDDSDPVDWSSFRREAAKDILCAMNCAPGPYMKSLQEAIHDAIEQADELIKQLRDGKE